MLFAFKTIIIWVSMKVKTHKILKKAHLIINDCSGIDIPKYKKDEAKRKAKKLLYQLKDYDPQIFERIKNDFK